MIEGVRPLLNPALVPVWRDRSTVQFGLSAERAVVIGGLDPALAGLIGLLDGFHSVAGLYEIARARGTDRATLDATLALLHDHGVVVDADESGLPDRDPAGVLAGVRAGEPAGAGAAAETESARAPDRLSAALTGGGTDTGRAVMADRAAAHVEVTGGGRVGASIARLLVAAGIGHVTCSDGEPVRVGDVVPGGLDRSATGHRRSHAVAEALSHDRPWRADDPLSAWPTGQRFVVVAPDTGTGRAEADELVRAGTPHLLARVEETTGVVGPLVVPGATSCVRCHDLHRTDRDPGWPTVLHRADLARPAVAACDASLAALVAGLAVAQVLGHLAGHDVAAVDGTIETTLPQAMPRRRSWRPHPACGCRWSDDERSFVEWPAEERGRPRNET